VLFSALFSIFVLYFIWIPLTCMGLLRTIGDEDGLPFVDEETVNAVANRSRANSSKIRLFYFGKSEDDGVVINGDSGNVYIPVQTSESAADVSDEVVSNARSNGMHNDQKDQNHVETVRDEESHL
jgi:preprotein translocase subunit SecF